MEHGCGEIAGKTKRGCGGNCGEMKRGFGEKFRENAGFEPRPWVAETETSSLLLRPVDVGEDGSAWEINFQSMVFETRRKPGPTKAKRYGGRWGRS